MKKKTDRNCQKLSESDYFQMGLTGFLFLMLLRLGAQLLFGV